MSEARGRVGKDRRDLPPGFVEITTAAATWVARADCADAIAAGSIDRVLAGPAVRAKRPGGGRGRRLSVRLAGRPAIAKRALHGGLLGRLLGEIYAGRGRALAAVHAAERLRGAGITTPEVLAVGWRVVAGPFSTHALVTQEVPGGVNLLEAAGSGIDRTRSGLLIAGSGDCWGRTKCG